MSEAVPAVVRIVSRLAVEYRGVFLQSSRQIINAITSTHPLYLSRYPSQLACCGVVTIYDPPVILSPSVDRKAYLHEQSHHAQLVETQKNCSASYR